MIKKLLLTSALFLLILLTSTSNSYAQGAYTCIVKFNNCTVDQSECDPGYSLPSNACFMAPAFTTNAKCQASGAACVPTGTEDSGNAVQNPNCNVDGGGLGIDTAIGCIPYEDPVDTVTFFVRWAIAVGGGVAFLLIIAAGFQIITASGSPEKIKHGQEMLTSAVAGLILIIFSVFVLRIIGVDILKLPGLT